MLINANFNKKACVVILLIFMQNICFSQTSVVGIGMFKIGKTNISIIDSVLKELKTTKVISYEDMKPFRYSHNYNKVYELKRDSLNQIRSDFHSTECKGFRVFYISTFKISDILVEDIYLTFKDNVLYSLIATSNELYEALKIKYPKFKLSMVEKNTNCVEGGLKYAKFGKDSKFTTTWSNGSIEAKIIENYYYTKDCEITHYDYINIYKIPEIFLFECDEKINKNREIRAKKALNDKLKDL